MGRSGGRIKEDEGLGCGEDFLKAGGEVEEGRPAGGANFPDGGGGVEDVARSGGGVADFRAEAGETQNQFG
jgi:hypothetical protein